METVRFTAERDDAREDPAWGRQNQHITCYHDYRTRNNAEQQEEEDIIKGQ